MTEEQKAEEYYYKTYPVTLNIGEEERKKEVTDIYLAGYHECQKEHEGKCKTAYIKGIRTMANALKDYDRTDGAWTDYFEHTVDNVLKDLLSKEIE